MNLIPNPWQRITNIALKFEHVDCRFSGRNGLDVSVFSDLNIEIPAHQFVAIIGPSGSGKSTILNMILGLVKPSHGTIRVCGLSPKQAAQDHMISFVPQSPALLSWRTTHDNVALPYELVNKKEPSGYITSLLDLVQLSGFERSYPHELSGGMRSRVSVARALSLKPDVLLLDEPFSSLDEFTAEDVARTIVDVWCKSRITVVMVTHNITQAVTYAQRVLVLGSRPQGILADIPIEIPYPRTEETLEAHDFDQFLSKIRRASHSSHEGRP